MREFKLDDNVLIEIKDATTGELLETRSEHNLVVDVGLNILRDMIGGERNFEPNFVALGTINTSAQSTNVALGDEQYRAAVTRRIIGSRQIVFQLFVPQASGNGVTYEEAGLFNVLNGTSSLFARVVFAPVVKTASVTISLSWTITLTAV